MLESRYTRIPNSSITHDRLFTEAVKRGEAQGEVGSPAYYVWRARRAVKGLRETGLSQSKTGLVYFIQSGSGGPIKIGLAIEPERRLSELQTGNPHELTLRASVKGGRVAERKYHRSFSEFHIRGEWFEPAPAILSEIERIKGGQ